VVFRLHAVAGRSPSRPLARDHERDGRHPNDPPPRRHPGQPHGRDPVNSGYWITVCASLPGRSPGCKLLAMIHLMRQTQIRGARGWPERSISGLRDLE
jgi:hypothetical protein